MEFKVDLNYNQILRLIRQLPEKDIRKLSDTLQSEVAGEKSADRLQDLIMEAPTWDALDIERYNEVRLHINKSRIA